MRRKVMKWILLMYIDHCAGCLGVPAQENCEPDADVHGAGEYNLECTNSTEPGLRDGPLSLKDSLQENGREVQEGDLQVFFLLLSMNWGARGVNCIWGNKLYSRGLHGEMTFEKASSPFFSKNSFNLGHPKAETRFQVQLSIWRVQCTQVEAWGSDERKGGQPLIRVLSSWLPLRHLELNASGELLMAGVGHTSESSSWTGEGLGECIPPLQSAFC